MDKARETALKALHEVNEKGAYANVALARSLRVAKLSEVDRRFATELVYGAAKAGGTLDWILRRYLNRPLSKIPPMVRDILRLGIYQLFFLARVPASAACNTAVEMTKRCSHAGTVKFVNAVLRTAAREPEKAAFPTGKAHEAENLALSLQHPEWLVRRWIRQFGYEEARALCEFDNAQATLSLRTNTLKITRDKLLERLSKEGVEAEPSAWTPEGILCLRHGSLDALESLQKGLFQVQDESSMLVAHVLAPKPGEFVLDVCSAPGGKTTHIAAAMGDCGRIVALDVHEHKMRRIAENCERLGIKSVEPLLLDAREAGRRFPRQADRVLVDAPCSGLGVLRRKPDARWRKSPDDLAALARLQREILSSAAEAVKSGGVLVYSTCTIEREENEAVVEDFLARHEEFSLENAGELLPLKKRPERMLQLYPQRDGTDGFFIARMRRR